MRNNASFRVMKGFALAATILVAQAGCQSDKPNDEWRKENAQLRKAAAQRPSDSGTPGMPLSDSPGAMKSASQTGSTAAPALGSAPTADQSKSIAGTDLPVYPGAVVSRQTGGHDNSVLSGHGVNMVLMESTDKFDAIVKFYTDKMSAPPKGSHAGTSLAKAERVQDKFRVVTLSQKTASNGLKSVTIHEDTGRTYIEMMNISGTESIPASVAPAGAGAARPPNVPDTSGGAIPPNDPLAPPPLLPKGL